MAENPQAIILEVVRNAALIDLTGLCQGHLKVVDLIPNGDLLALGIVRRRNHLDRWWWAVCDCGRKKAFPASRIRHGKVKSCGCSVGENNAKRRPFGEAARTAFFCQYKLRCAKARGLCWGLSFDEFLKLTASPCFYCGCQPRAVFGNEKYHGTYLHNGIDRKDNTRGYIIDNCVPCCRRCNVAKHIMSLNEFREWVVLVFRHFVEGGNAAANAKAG